MKLIADFGIMISKFQNRENDFGNLEFHKISKIEKTDFGNQGFLNFTKIEKH